MWWAFTSCAFSRQEGVHEERVDPLLSGWVHVREVAAELLDAGDRENVASGREHTRPGVCNGLTAWRLRMACHGKYIVGYA